jgi:hypothetical protein
MQALALPPLPLLQPVCHQILKLLICVVSWGWVYGRQLSCLHCVCPLDLLLLLLLLVPQLLLWMQQWHSALMLLRTTAWVCLQKQRPAETKTLNK